MLIKALNDYYDFLEGEKDDEQRIPDCMSMQKVDYKIFLDVQGNVTDIVDIREKITVTDKKGKEKTTLNSLSIALPKRTQKPGIDLNIIEHRPLYIFGLNFDKGVLSYEDKTDKAKKSHQMFCDGNKAFFQDLKSDISVAFYNFMEKWQPEIETENPKLLALGKDYSTCYYCFALDGHPEIMLHTEKEVVDKYIAMQSQMDNSQGEDEIISTCAITGEKLPIARIHEKISGIKGGMSVGTVLVGCKDSAFESYGKTQSYNSNISEFAMKKYTSALNTLIADKNHRIYIDELTIVFFAMSGNDKNECDFFSNCLFGSSGDEKADTNLSAVYKQIIRGKSSDLSAFSLDSGVEFYVFGLTPNNSRISQKFILHNKFGKIVENVAKHQIDMAVSDSGYNVSLSNIAKQLVQPNSKTDTIPPPIFSAIFTAIINGTNYPNSLLETVIRRIKSDSDDDKNKFIKMNDTRIGIIKACLNRKARFQNKKEEITMALDTENKNSAYLCGRLFAILEKIQQDASGGGLNKTIKNSYFTSAACKPATVFPKLIMLAQHHLDKLEYANHWNSRIGEIVDMLEDEFPSMLSLDEQGKFIIGYYQQNKSLYTKAESKKESE